MFYIELQKVKVPRQKNPSTIFFPILYYHKSCVQFWSVKSFLIPYCPPAPLAPPLYKNILHETQPTNNFVPMQYYVKLKTKQNRIAIKVTIKNPSKTSSHIFEFFSVIFILAKSLWAQLFLENEAPLKKGCVYACANVYKMCKCLSYIVCGRGILPWKKGHALVLFFLPWFFTMRNL